MAKRFIELKGYSRVVFIGDLHGDLDAAKNVVSKYQHKGTCLVFLGDYVDRGENSFEVVDLVFSLKDAILLMGNHEAYPIIPCQPADFWDAVQSKGLYEKYSSMFLKLPFAVSVGDVIALHGCLPDINNLKEIDSISFNSDNFKAITWGDISEEKGFLLEPGFRPRFGKDYFDSVMKKLGKKTLIRGHDPRVKGITQEGRCITLLTSSSYTNYGMKGRLVAVMDVKSGKINIEKV